MISLAVLVTVARYLMPNINEYRPALEQFIQVETGVEISIGHIEGSWEASGPYLNISNISFDSSIASDNQFESSIDSVKVSVATFPSLFYRTLISERLIINGLSLRLQQQPTTEFVLPDIEKINDDKTGKNPLIAADLQDWLQHQSRITFYDTALEIGLLDGEQFPISVDEIHFEKGKDGYQLTGLSKLPGDNNIDFILEVDGFLTDPTSTGHIYIDTHRLTMAELPLKAIWKGAEIHSGELDLKLWAEWKNSRIENGLIAIKSNDFQMSLQGEPQTKLNKLDTYLIWQRYTGGWILESQETEIISQGKVSPDPSLLVKMTQVGKHKDFNISASRLDVGLLADLLLANPNLEDALRTQLLTMDINGFLIDSQIWLGVTENSIYDLRVNARFSEIAWNHWNHIPGINNLVGEFELYKNRGTIIIDSRDFSIDYPSLFRWPMDVESLTSRVAWQLSDETIALELTYLDGQFDHLQLKADGLFNINRDNDQMDLNLYSEFENNDISTAKYYLPSSIMSNTLVTYLDQSIKSGKLHSTQILLRGNAKDFPFSNTEGVFVANTHLTDTSFIFAEGWPELTNLNAELLFVENSMNITVTEGLSHQQNILSATVSIDDFSSTPTILRVITDSSGILETGISYINNSPLQQPVGSIFEIIPAKGPFNLDLDLKIPLEGEQKIIVDGKINLLGNSIIVKPINMLINNIQGEILLTDSLVNAKAISAELMGGKSTVELQQSLNIEEGLITSIKTKGSMSSEGLRNIFPDWVPKQIEGHSSYSSDIQFPETKQDTDVVMDLALISYLVGFDSHLPEPFMKVAEQKETLTLNIKILENKQQLFSASLGDFIDLKLLKSENTAPTGEIILGGKKATWSDNNGIKISGLIEQFDLEAWLPIFQKQEEQGGSLNTAGYYPHFFADELIIDSFKYYVLSFKQLDISANVDDNILNFNVKSNDLAGEVKIPYDLNKFPIELNLTKLHILEQIPKENFGDSKRASSSEPLPSIKLNCQDCSYNNKALGITQLNISPLENGNTFTLTIKEGDLLGSNVTGRWLRDSNDIVTTNVEGKVNTKNLGNVLETLNIQSGIHDTKFNINGQLNWQGNPFQFNYETINGALTFDGGKGHQEDVSDKDARIFSLFSIGSLARKLTLDFSDLFGKGFYYTNMDGDFKIDNGVFKTDNFKINGTSADVEIVGISDLGKNKIKNCVLVTPDLSASLPVLAGWAIEPVTGVIVFLMSKIFQPALKVVTSIKYQIEGSFDNTVVTELGKSQGTATVDNTTEDGKSIITTESEQADFSCDDVFNN